MRLAAGHIRVWGIIGLLLLMLVSSGARVCLAHPANIPAATAQIQADGTYEVRVRFDVLAFLLEETSLRVSDGPMNGLLDGPDEELRNRLADGEKRFREELRVSGDAGAATVDSVVFPTAEEIVRWRDSGIQPRLPVMGTVTIRGHLPVGAKTVSFRFSDLLGTVVLTTELPYREPVSEPLDPGAVSTPLPLPTADEIAQAKAAMLAPRPKEKVSPSPLSSPTPAAVRVKQPVSEKAAVVAPSPKPSPSPTPQPSPRVSPSPSASPLSLPVPEQVQPVVSPSPVVAAVPVRIAPLLPWYAVIGRYIKLGYLHILPEGLDHILFVLGLFLLSTRMKSLLAQVTAFTVAHSLTLALALYGVVRLPSNIVEPIIAASIAFVAIENLFVTEMKAWRPAVVFGFGLIHGLGFAGALQDLGLQKRDLLTALIGFNGGVELGQLTVVAVALLTVGWFRSRPYYRARVVIPGSLIIAAVALFWVFQRLHG